MDTELLARAAPQQPGWERDPRLGFVRAELARRPPLVRMADVVRLRSLLAVVAVGEAQVILSGDCAEDPAQCGFDHVSRKTGLLDLLAGSMKMTAQRSVLRAGRIAGQFGKPRSRPTEWVGGLELPVYRGHMVNSPEPDPVRREPNPLRMLECYHAAHSVMCHLGWTEPSVRCELESPVWTSHEALLLDYEVPMLRRLPDGGLLLGSTHWPWIGERTRRPDGAHVELLSTVVNPVACKVGPAMTAEELLVLCEKLDPERSLGRLTLVVRMGSALPERLPPLVDAVAAAGHPVIWLTDPMHGNTVTTPVGLKTRYVDTMVREVRQFQGILRACGVDPGGLHLETTPDAVTECVANESAVDEVTGKYTTFCDPRLNPGQALSLVSAWTG